METSVMKIWKQRWAREGKQQGNSCFPVIFRTYGTEREVGYAQTGKDG